MNQETQQLYIDTCKRLGKLEDFAMCPLNLHHWKSEIGESIIDFRKSFGDSNFPPRCFKYKKATGAVIGPYLPISDLEKWSSAKILARAGYTRGQIVNNFTHMETDKRTSTYLEWLLEAYHSTPEGELELKYMLLVLMLYEIDRPAYDKGMGPLLEGER